LPLAVNRHRTVTLRDFGLPLIQRFESSLGRGPDRADRDLP
jgi:hypothetical protein